MKREDGLSLLEALEIDLGISLPRPVIAETRPLRNSAFEALRDALKLHYVKHIKESLDNEGVLLKYIK